MTEKIIYVSETNGFCKGVKNAVDTALRYAGENVYTFGEIVHNKRVVNKLASLGIRMTEDVSGLKKGDTLIIRSHGAKKSVFEQCEKSGVKVVDAIGYVLDCRAPFSCFNPAFGQRMGKEVVGAAINGLRRYNMVACVRNILYRMQWPAPQRLLPTPPCAAQRYQASDWSAGCRYCRAPPAQTVPLPVRCFQIHRLPFDRLARSARR